MRLGQTDRHRQGSAILLVIVLLFVAGVIIVPVTQRAVFQHGLTHREHRYITAMHLAEAGLEDALWNLTHGGPEPWESWNTTDTAHYRLPVTEWTALGGDVIGELEASVVFDAGDAVISATAGVPDLTSRGSEIRVVQVTHGGGGGGAGLVSLTDIVLQGTSDIDSYDSSQGPYGVAGNKGSNGNVHANGNISIGGSSKIDGNVDAGGTVSNQNSATGKVRESVALLDHPIPYDEVNAAKANNNNSEIYGSGYNSNTHAVDMNPPHTLNLPGGTKDNPKVYYFSSMSVKGTLNVQGYVEIYIDGGIDTTATCKINLAGAGNPEQLKIISSGSDTIAFTGAGGANASVYAPNAPLVMRGTGSFYGHFVAKHISMAGTPSIHLDQSLVGGGSPVVKNWVERTPYLAGVGDMK